MSDGERAAGGPLIPLGGEVHQAPRVPGSSGERFQRFPTDMVPVTPPPVSAEAVIDAASGAEAGGENGGAEEGALLDGEPELIEWAQPPPPLAAPHRGVAGWGLGFSIAGLLVSFVVGWGFPIALVGVVTAALALRRPLESRAIAAWALALGIAALVFSAGWLIYAATSANLFG